MYPSLDIATFASVAKEEFIRSNLKIDTDNTELALYLAVTRDSKEIEYLGLDQVVHTRIHKNGSKHGITMEEILDRQDKTSSKFNPSSRAPTDSEARLIFALALETL